MDSPATWASETSSAQREGMMNSPIWFNPRSSQWRRGMPKFDVSGMDSPGTRSNAFDYYEEKADCKRVLLWRMTCGGMVILMHAFR